MKRMIPISNAKCNHSVCKTTFYLWTKNATPPVNVLNHYIFSKNI